MKQYTSPRIDIISIQSASTLLIGSDRTIPIVGGEEQVNAW